MNLILHQFKTDCRHFRFWLAAWWTSLILGLVMLHWVARRDLSEELLDPLMFFQMLIGVILTVRLVQADPMVETSAFWLTRPIRRFHLACCKTFFLSAFLLAPYLLMLSASWLSSAGFSTALWFKALTEYGLIAGTVMLAMATTAALTKNFRQFLLLCVLAVVACLLWAGFLFTLERFGWLKEPYSNVIPKHNRLILMWLILVSGMASAWAVQAFGNSRRWCLAVFTVAFFLAIPIGMYWKGAEIFVHTAPVSKVGVSLTLLEEGDSLDDIPGSQILWSHFRVNGLAENQLAAVSSLQGVFQAGKKSSVNVNTWRAQWGRWVLDNYEADLFRLVRGNFPSNTLWFGSLQTQRDSALPLPDKKNTTFKPGTGRFYGNMWMSIFDLKKLADMPLKSHMSSIVMPGRRVDIVSIHPSSENIRVLVANTVPDLIIDPHSTYDSPVFRNDCIYVLYHPDFGEAYPRTSNNGYGTGSGLGLGTEGNQTELNFPFPALRAQLTGITAQEWLSHARLLIFEPIEHGIAATISEKNGSNNSYFRFSKEESHFEFSKENYLFKLIRSTDAPQSGQIAGLAAINAAKLPSRADSTQIERYVKTIAANASDNLTTVSTPTINKKMEAIGSNSVSVLARMLPFEEQFENVIVEPFLIKNATRADLPDLLKALPRDMALARFFQEKHWEEDARATILSLLPDHRTVFSDEALMIAASAKDPKSYTDLSWHFVHAKYQSFEVVDALRQCPGFDVDATVREAWKLAQLGLGSDQPLSLIAAEQGLPEALNVSLRKVATGLMPGATRRLEQLLDYHGTEQDFAGWVSQHFNQFRYKPAERRYALAE